MHLKSQGSLRMIQILLRLLNLQTRKMLNFFRFNTSCQKLTIMLNTFILRNQKRLIMYIWLLLKLKQTSTKSRISSLMSQHVHVVKCRLRNFPAVIFLNVVVILIYRSSNPKFLMRVTFLY